nr:Spo0B domain-containing protein [uncultured Niameybacter sp.]
MDFKKLIKLTLLVNIFQVILIVIFIAFITYNPSRDMYILLYGVGGLTLLNSMVTVISYYVLIQKEEGTYTPETIKNLENLNTVLREQRHDYLNHVQVIYGLMELGEYEEAKKYMEPVYNDLIKVGKALKTAHPAVNALLQAKIQKGEKENINVYVEVKSNLKHIPMEPWELCKILANIIDNQITALGQREPIRKLYIDIGENGTSYIFSIYNNGPIIEEDILPHLFVQGVSTKKEDDCGMGLYIVKRIVDRVGGRIEVDSNLEKTCFTVELPKL